MTNDPLGYGTQLAGLICSLIPLLPAPVSASLENGTLNLFFSGEDSGDQAAWWVYAQALIRRWASTRNSIFIAPSLRTMKLWIAKDKFPIEITLRCSELQNTAC